MEIRNATAGDRPAIRRVVQRSFREATLASSRTRERLLKRRYSPWPLSVRIEQEESVCVLAERDGEVIGFAEGTDEREDGRIEWLHVAPEHRGEGVGAELFEELRDELTGAGPSSRSATPG